MGVFW
jgi:hypothetical protein